MNNDTAVQQERDAVLEEVEMRLGPDWRQEMGVQKVRWGVTERGRQLLAIDGRQVFGFGPGGQFISYTFTGDRTARLIVGDADHCWHRDVELTNEEMLEWAEMIGAFDAADDSADAAA